MPSRKRIKTLHQLSLESFVRQFVKSWEVKRRHLEECSREFSELISSIPYSVLNAFVFEAFRTYTRRRRLSNKCLCDFLTCLFVTKLTLLDLHTLVTVGARRKSHVLTFEKTLLSSFPVLSNLRRLSLATHSVKTSLPICTDLMLQEISYHLHNLHILDISYNKTVSDNGLNHLIPQNGRGCPFLEEVFVFGCSVSVVGVANVVDSLRCLRIIGYKETAEVLRYLYWRFLQSGDVRFHDGLQLTHVNNTGICGESRPFEFSKMLVHITKQLCPKLFNLKVRVEDSTLPSFDVFTSLTALDLIYNTGRSLTLGVESLNYFKLCGNQLKSLTLKCGPFNSKNFLAIGEYCRNLHHFWFTCYYMIWDFPEENFQNYSAYTVLETLYFQIGISENDRCVLPLPLFKYFLKSTQILNDLRIISRSETMTDLWLRDLWETVKTDKLHKVLIALPNCNNQEGVLPLTMMSVNTILEQSPHLQYLGNLRVWNISQQEVWFLNTYLNMCNYDVNILHCPMKIK